MASVSTLVELLSSRAHDLDERPAFRFLDDPDRLQEQTTWSFAELDRRARAVGQMLASRLAPGDRALLVYPPGLDFLAGFFGCLYAGVVATPATYPKPRRPLPRMSRIAVDSGARIALTTSATLEALDLAQQDEAAQRLEWVGTDELTPPAADWSPYAASLDDLAFLQYTSGSTSEPKGVMVTHRNLMANLEAIRQSFALPFVEEVGAEDVHGGVFWLPAYHDMGLIGGILTPLYVGGPSALMAPASFLQRPLRWLEAIDHYAAAVSGAPNFAYRLCVEKSSSDERDALDLSSWKLAFCGAEPIHADTLIEFADAFEPAGFRATAYYPCYGLAEATLLAAGPRADEPPRIVRADRKALGQGRFEPASDDAGQAIVGCGGAPRGHELRIVDSQSLVECEEGQVGEVVVSGPSIARGYWRRDEESAATFGCRLPDSDATWLRTGDLGFVHGGDLFVTGRVKDVIILFGRNLYPQDVEATAEAAHPALLPGAAFSVDVDGQERLVLVHQIDRACRGNDRQPAIDAARAAVRSEHEVEPWAVVLIRPASLPITSSGKVQRGACREQFLAGQLKVMAEWREPVIDKTPTASVGTPPDVSGLPISDAADRIERYMFDWLVARAGIDAADWRGDKPFAEFGLDSMTAVEMSGELEKGFGISLPPTVVWNYPTPDTLSRYIAEQTLATGAPPAPSVTNPSDAPGSDAEVDALLAEMEGLSDEEARRLLDS